MIDIELISGTRPSVDHLTLPLALIAALAGDFLCCLKQCLLQNKEPSHSPSLNIAAIFLPQLGCIMLSHLGSPHFSKLSSAFRHFAHSLHVLSIWPFTAWLWMKWEFEGKNENQKRLSYSKKHLWGVSQSDFVFQKIFIWMKTQKHDLKLNWQPLLNASIGICHVQAVVAQCESDMLACIIHVLHSQHYQQL